jgi:hypothetical protein
MRNKKWVPLLAYVTGSVNQELLLQNEYLAAEHRILSRNLVPRDSRSLWNNQLKARLLRPFGQ